MFVLPVGLEAKTTGTPWATLTIVVVVSFYSFLNWNAGQKLTEFYLHSPEHKGYMKELKAFVGSKCGGEKWGAKYHREVLPEHFLRFEIFEKLHEASLGKEFVECAKPFFDETQVNNWNDPTLAAIYGIYAQRKAQVLEAENLLSYDNLNFKSVLRSMFLHGGFMHLFGNLLFLLLLAFPVEQRMGHALFLLTYMFSGAIGMILSTLASPETLFTVGASGNIFGIAGAFLALFYKKQMRVLVSFFFVNNRVVLLPVAIYFGFWIVAEEAFSVLKSAQDGVAHVAHLAGFVTGGFIAFVYNKMRSLPEGYTYPYEFELQVQLDDANEVKRKFKIYHYWLSLNPSNRPITLESLQLAEADLASENIYAAKYLDKNALEILKRSLFDTEMIEAMPVEGLRLPPRTVAPRTLKKALEKHLNDGNTMAEWKILYALTQGSDDAPLEWVQRMQELTAELHQRPDLSAKFQMWAKRNAPLRAMIPEPREKRIINVG